MEVLPHRMKLPHVIPGWVREEAVFFITICCQRRGIDQLCDPVVADCLLEATAFRQRMGRWHVHLLLLMPDHLHALVSFPRTERMRRVISTFKEMTAKRAGIGWQRDFFDHRLRARESYEQKAAYIRMNPVRAGLVANPSDWPWKWEPTNLPEGGPSGPALPAE